MIRRPGRAVFLAFALLLPALPGRAADISAFIATAEPGERWGGGFGAAFGITFFQILHLEAEGAHISGELTEQSHDSLMGSAMIAPSFGRLVPYAGVGVGGYWQKYPGRDDDTGLERNFVAGLKVKLGLVFLKGEYRHISLPEERLIDYEHRFSVGAGISF